MGLKRGGGSDCCSRWKGDVLAGGFQFVCSPANDKVTHTHIHNATNARQSVILSKRGISCLPVCRFFGLWPRSTPTVISFPRCCCLFFFCCCFLFFRFPESHLPFLNPSSQVCCFVYRPVPPIITGRFARGISRGHPINPSPLRR